MKKGIIALAFIFGFYFVHAQDKHENMSDMEMEQNTEYRDYGFDTEETITDTDLKKTDKEVVVIPEESTETSTAKVKEKKKVKKDDSFIENVVEAPFKFVGTTVGEVGRGVGHILWAPFKGVINLFDGDSKEKKKAKLQYSEQVSNENATKLQNEETFEVKAKTEDDRYKYNSSYDSEESGNSTDTDYMYIH